MRQPKFKKKSGQKYFLDGSYINTNRKLKKFFKLNKKRKHNLKKQGEKFYLDYAVTNKHRRIKRIYKPGPLFIVKNKKKRHWVARIVSLTLAGGLLGFLAANHIMTNIYNNVPPIRTPLPPDVVAPNGSDFDFDDNGQIVMDSISEEEKIVLLDTLKGVLIKDASLYEDVKSVKDILSISMFPYNLDDSDNEFEKYCISILFNQDNDSQEVYASNYLTSDDFISNAELSKDYFADFINYLSYNTAFDNCQKMSEEAQNLKSHMGDSVTFVEAPYISYDPSGDEYYFIPVINSDGSGTLYYSWASSVNTLYDGDPMALLDSELSSGSFQEFLSMPFIENPNLQAVYKIYQDNLQNIEPEKSPEIDENKEPEK